MFQIFRSFFCLFALGLLLSFSIPTLAQAPTSNTNTPITTNSDDNDTAPQETLGTHALDLTINIFDSLREQSEAFTSNIAALPQLASWYTQQTTDQRLQSRWTAIRADSVAIIGIPFLAALVLELILFPARRLLCRRQPRYITTRIATVLGFFGLKLIPILVFAGVALNLLDQNEAQKVPRFVTLSLIDAIGLSCLTFSLIRSLLMPNAATLRLIPVTDPQASYIHRWLGFFSFVIIYGYFFINIARALHVPPEVLTACLDLIAFTLVVMAITVITQKRSFVAALLRGNLSAAQTNLSFFDNLRLWFARSWHVLFITYLIIGYIVTALGVENGFALMLRGTVLSLSLLLVTRLLLRITVQHIRNAFFRPLLQTIIWVVTGLAAAMAWGADIPALFTMPLGQRILGGVFSVGSTIIFLTLVYEAFSIAAERHLNRRDAEGQILAVGARTRTLLPMIRNTAFVVFATIIGMVVLSEIGVNIGPLMAGAGVVGVAVGFGSQTLVKDFLTGLFIIIENTIAIGDVVKIGDHAGTVEGMSMRTVRLRDADGALHILPFSEVSKIINTTRDFNYAQISVGVAYNSDLDKVMCIMREIGADMQKDPDLKYMILDPIQIQGVDNLGDFSITILSRIRTRPGKNPEVRRAFLLRMKQRFDAEGIEIPFPTVTSIRETKA